VQLCLWENVKDSYGYSYMKQKIGEVRTQECWFVEEEKREQNGFVGGHLLVENVALVSGDDFLCGCSVCQGKARRYGIGGVAAAAVAAAVAGGEKQGTGEVDH